MDNKELFNKYIEEKNIDLSIFWPNNKRRMYHLPMRRKPFNKNYYWKKCRNDLFFIMEEIVNKTLAEDISKMFDKFIDISEV